MALPPMLQMVGMMSCQIPQLLIDMKHKANCKENPEVRFTFPLGSPSNKLTISILTLIASSSLMPFRGYFPTVNIALIKLPFKRLVFIHWQGILSLFLHTKEPLRKSKLFTLYFPINHNYNKIVKSDWLSTVLISALVGQCNRTVHIMPK